MANRVKDILFDKYVALMQDSFELGGDDDCEEQANALLVDIVKKYGLGPFNYEGMILEIKLVPSWMPSKKETE